MFSDSPIIMWTFNILAALLIIYFILWVVVKAIEISHHFKARKDTVQINARCDELEAHANKIESEIKDSMASLSDLPMVERVSIETKFQEALNKGDDARNTIKALRMRYPIEVTQ